MEVIIELQNAEEALALYGRRDEHIRLLRDRFDVDVVARNDLLKLHGDGDAVAAAEGAVHEVLDQLRTDGAISSDEVEAVLEGTARLVEGDGGGRPRGPRDDGEPEGPDEEGREPAEERTTTRADASAGPEVVAGYGPRTEGQAEYVEAIRSHDIVFGIGPAGTGKTFLAVLMAVEALKSGQVQRISLVRPAVEAGENLGYLPGDVQAKVNPYLRPLYDALHEILDYDTVQKYLEREVIEIIPLAYMRGRTLNRAFIILDEAQNTTRSQMQMFLTRMGEGSKIVATGDISQVDIPAGSYSGLIHATGLLRGIRGIEVHTMTNDDIVRHPLVWQIVDAYEKDGGEDEDGDGGGS